MSDSHPRALTHVGLTVTDVEAAMEWYGDVFGFDVVAEPTTVAEGDGLRWRRASNLIGIEFDSVRIGHLTTGNQVGLELFEFDTTDAPTDTHPAEPGFFHVGVLDPDIEGLARRIDETGGDHYAEIWALTDEAARLTYCRDPWGNRIEIYTQSHERYMVADLPEQ